MYPLLYKYFSIHKKLDLPGIGCFYVQKHAAVNDYTIKQVSAPIPAVAFTATCTKPDPSLEEFIALETNISAGNSTGLETFFKNLQYQLEQNDTIELPFFGRLTKGDTGLDFAPALSLSKYFPPVKAERIVREDAEHQILVGDAVRTNTQMIEHFDDNAQRKQKTDYWWIYALLLLLVSLGIIGYYYWQQQSVQQVYSSY